MELESRSKLQAKLSENEIHLRDAVGKPLYEEALCAEGDGCEEQRKWQHRLEGAQRPLHLKSAAIVLRPVIHSMGSKYANRTLSLAKCS